MGNLVRIGERLFNLDHIIVIEPDEGRGPGVMAVRMEQGREAILDGDDARAARNLVHSFRPFPSDFPTPDGSEGQSFGQDADREVQVSHDVGGAWARPRVQAVEPSESAAN